MFKIVVLILSLATGQPLAISFSVDAYDAKTCASLMLAATREVMKDFVEQHQHVSVETRCVPKEMADAWKRGQDKIKAGTDKVYDL
jgi:hypothetical protein